MGSHPIVTHIPVWSLWPEGLAIITSVIYLATLKRLPRVNLAGHGRVRILSVVGLLTCIYTVYIGLFPSIYSIAMVFVIPALFGFGALILRPHLVLRHGLRIYLALSVAVSGLCGLSELIWLLHLRAAA